MPEYTLEDCIKGLTPYKVVQMPPDQKYECAEGEVVMQVVHSPAGRTYWIGEGEEIVAEKPTIHDLKRSELNALAIRLDIEEPKKFKNAPSLIEAIEEAAQEQGKDLSTML